MAGRHQPLAVEVHPQRDKILEARAAGESMKSISAWTNPYVSTMALARYFGRVNIAATVLQSSPLASNLAGAKITAADLASSLPDANFHLARLRKRYADIDEMIDKAKAADDFRGFANIASVENKNVELDGRFSGALQDRPSVSVSIELSFGGPTATAGPPMPAGDVIDIDPSE